MGCGATIQEKLIDRELTDNFEFVGIHTIDEKFNKLSKHLKFLEQYRKVIHDRKDHLLLITGACELKKPNLFKTFLAGMWKISTDYKV